MDARRQWTMDDLYEHEAARGATTLSRREFVRTAGVTGAGMALLAAAGCAPKDGRDEPDGAAPSGMQGEADPFADCDVFYAACSPECQHHNLACYVRDGEVVKVGIGKANESLPCMRGLARYDWLRSDERLTTPLLRTGEKGEGSWKEIGWDEALDLMAQKLSQAIAEHGNKAVLFDSHAGNFHRLPGEAMNAFRARIGGSASMRGSLCCAAAHSTTTPIWGKRFFDTRNTIAEADYIIIWGNNPAITQGGYWYRYEQCMDAGGHVVVIDPVYSESASKASDWVPIRPTTDCALALDMTKYVVDEGLVDEAMLKARTTAPCLVDAQGALALDDPEDEHSYLVLDEATGDLVRHDAAGAAPALSVAGTPHEGRYTTVFDLIVAECDPWTPEAVSQETGIPVPKVEELMSGYAHADRAMIIDNMGGFMRNSRGADCVAAQMNLVLFSGHLGRRGCGLCDAGGINNLVPTSPMFDNPDVDPDLPVFPRATFGRSILADDPNPIDVFVSICENPMSQFPNTGAVKEALCKIPFVAVIDMFMTSTALYADLVLPCAAVFETEDLLVNARSHLVQLSEKAVDPPGQARNDLWIFKQLAERFGFGDDFADDPRFYVERALEGSGYTYEQLAREKAIDAMPPEFVPYEDGTFYTDSGKAELYQAGWLAKGHPGVPTYGRCAESVGGSSGLDARYPLAAVQRKTRYSVHSTFTHLPLVEAQGGGAAICLMNEQDARDRGISEGDTVTVYNDRGEHRATAQLTAHQMAGVVALDNGIWEQQGGSSSYVTNDAAGVIGDEHCCNETLVEVRKGA